jgi:hypothetical protein
MTRPPRRTSSSTHRAVDRLARDMDGLARVLHRRLGHARRWDPHACRAPRRNGTASASEGGVGG